MAESPITTKTILLWGSPDSLHCSMQWRAEGSPFDITVLSAASVVKRMSFERYEDASNFAIAEMRAAKATAQ